MSAAEAAVIDATDASFETDVLEASRHVPVVVDFWAPWCGPCRTLGPLLERLAAESGGAFRLVKIDIDRNPRTAQSFGVQSIPFVLAFRDGEIVNEFVGAQPERVVRQFLERIAPDEAERLAAEGEKLAATGDAVGAEARFRDALAKRPGQPYAALGLARVLAGSQPAEAAKVLATAAPGGRLQPEIDRLAAELRVRGTATDAAEDEARLRAQLAETPDDLAARLALGRVLAAAGRYEEAFEAFLDVVRRDREFEDGAARRAMLDLFTLLGRDDPRADRYQRELSRVLYS